MTHSRRFLLRVSQIACSLDAKIIEKMVDELVKAKRIFVIGLGGSAANASHFVNDLRKLCSKEAICPTDNVAYFTACGNDHGWNSVFGIRWQKGDLLFVLSVGGGTENVSQSITRAVMAANYTKIPVLGVVGPIGGFTKLYGDLVLHIPEEKNPTPYTEAFQGVVTHAIVSHPKLQKEKTKW